MLSRLLQKFFDFILNNRLIYNTCREDPRIDRELLRLGPESTMVAITSAGCNVLDYLPGRRGKKSWSSSASRDRS